MRSEETAGRAEPLLATALSRTGWVASHLAVAMVAIVGGVVVLLAGGLGLGLAAAAVIDDTSMLPRVLGAALAYTPALWVTIGVVTALYGLLPRAVSRAWVVVGYSFALALAAGLDEQPVALRPIPHLPIDDLTLRPLFTVSDIAAAPVLVGLASFRHRDMQP